MLPESRQSTLQGVCMPFDAVIIDLENCFADAAVFRSSSLLVHADAAGRWQTIIEPGLLGAHGSVAVRHQLAPAADDDEAPLLAGQVWLRCPAQGAVPPIAFGVSFDIPACADVGGPLTASDGDHGCALDTEWRYFAPPPDADRLFIEMSARRVLSAGLYRPLACVVLAWTVIDRRAQHLAACCIQRAWRHRLAAAGRTHALRSIGRLLSSRGDERQPNATGRETRRLRSQPTFVQRFSSTQSLVLEPYEPQAAAAAAVVPAAAVRRVVSLS
eukprot:TRINITY_DN300_c0_g2_i1.p1 TRINITY_DN300_c0_g2~~TRINITY_DN300_c0_g2_i1.p1  ORF type:complete len:272 (-),score=55.38 TRINITY_DN300_c0_g2_i1:389-1204(-)